MLHGLKKFLEHKAYKMRLESLKMTTKAQSGHVTSALSCADLVAALFFYAMHFDPQIISNPENDRFILSKGHASPILYAVWKELGALTNDELMTYRQLGSALEGHATARFKYNEAATGSLGIGLSIGAGMALAARLDEQHYYTYVLMGDSEITEGSVWEAAEIAAYYKLSHLVGIVDCNRLGQSTQTIHGYHAQRYAQKFEAFGWKAVVIDGHDMLQIAGALDKARQNEDRPFVIIAKTVKGYGVDRVENKENWHGKAFTQKELPEILSAFEQRFASVAANGNSYQWQPTISQARLNVFQEKKVAHECKSLAPEEFEKTYYKKDEKVATRKAYGQALTQAGGVCNNIISLDAEVKNSTFAQIFEDKYPDRFFQCFVAEQNMVGMGIGFEKRGKIPFISTFACFFSRAHDQIRMAAIGKSSLRLVGSHSGISIGEDGPSQMGLEDIAMMRALPESIVLYPSDAVSTHALVNCMVEYNAGISYLRTTRGDTPILYGADEKFIIGGCKVLRSGRADQALIIGAGITVHQALQAYEQLIEQGIAVAIIDLYSIKPLDVKTIEQIAIKAGNRIITVEDHYIQGGIGEAITYALRNNQFHIQCLAVPALPMSGKSEELLAWAGIGADGIIRAVKEMIT